MHRRAAILLAVLLLAVAGLGLIASRQHHDPPDLLPPRAAANRPTLLLLTTLPLVFGEDFAIADGGSPLLARLEQRYAVQPIGIADKDSLSGARLLLMAHPLAQTAEALVDLDAWVRQGGRVLLLADPMLEWPSQHPLGDPLRPPPGFADTGLLQHWGLTLSAPPRRGVDVRNVEGRPVRFDSPGRLAGRCAISDRGRIARCTIGRGQATIIADADFVNADAADAAAGQGGMELVLNELAKFESWHQHSYPQEPRP